LVDEPSYQKDEESAQYRHRILMINKYIEEHLDNGKKDIEEIGHCLGMLNMNVHESQGQACQQTSMKLPHDMRR